MEDISNQTIILSLIASVVIIAGISFIIKLILRGTGGSLQDIIRDSTSHPSLSLFQFFVWTFIVAFAYLAIYLMRISAGVYEITGSEEIPQNVLALIGISVAVPIISHSAKGLTKSNSSQKPPLKNMFLSSKGTIDLPRFQMFMWTWIGVIIFLFVVFSEILIEDTVHELFVPDISPTLLILMGLSQGAYLGGKFVGNKDQDANDGSTQNNSNPKPPKDNNPII